MYCLGPPWWNEENLTGVNWGGNALGELLELVWFRDLGLIEALGQLEYPDPTPICAMKVVEECKQ